MKGIRLASVWGEQLLQDVRYALRSLRGSPAFSLAVILTLAVAIGMNTAIFSVFNAVVLRPIGYPYADRLVWIATTLSPDEPGFVTSRDFVDWRGHATSFDSLVAYGNGDYTLVSPQGAVRVRAAMVTEDFWNLSGAALVAGRLPLPGERDVVLLINGLAQRWFGADPDVIGRTVTLDGRQAAVIGILPDRFRFQLPGSAWPGFRPRDVEVYQPMIVSAPAGPGPMMLLSVVGRLKSDRTLTNARAEIEAMRARSAQARGKSFDDHRILRVTSLHDQLIGNAGVALRVLLGAVAFVLLIACANAANLHLARASARRREMAVRIAVGAGRARVLRQLLVESLVLAALGSTAGVLVARLGLAAILRIDRHAIPRLVETTIDGRVLAVVLGMAVLAALAFGLAPAFSLWNVQPHDALKSGSRMISPAASSLRIRRVLVAGEVALALMLLIGAGLMTKSAWRMYDYPPGFQPDRVLMAKIEFAGPQYSDPRRSLAFADTLLGRVRREPGVVAATISTHGYMLAPGLVVEGDPDRKPGELDQKPPIMINATSAGLKDVLGLRMLRGRWFTHGERAAVLNESLARREMPGRDPIGRRIQVNENGPWLTIVGIVADLKYSQLDAAVEPEVYVPYSTADGLFGFIALIRTANDPLQLAASLRQAVSDIDKSQVPDDVISLEQALGESIAPRRLNLFLFGTFAAAAIFVAMIGVYGVMAYSVTQRVHEIGVRMALGAERRNVVNMVIRQGMLVAAAGIVAGLAGALLLSRVMNNLLYAVEPSDPFTFGVLASGLGAISFAACCIPALKAAFVDPAVTLRHD
jgi:putative ABC transport system permease protein